MTSEQKIEILREGWETSIFAVEKSRIFLRGLLESQWYFYMRNELKEILEELDHAAEIAERDFKPDVIS